MNAGTNFAAAWVLDFGVLASVLLMATIIGRWLCRAPGQRMAVVWGAWLGLLLLAVLTALPLWPRRELAELILRPSIFIFSRAQPTQGWSAPIYAELLPAER